MYLVTGATGGLGRRVVRSLREQDKPVRAFVQLSSNYTELESRGAEIFIGDLQQERDIEKACQGVEYIISCHGSNESSGSAQELDYRANIDLIEKAKANGVKHFVFTSVLGVDRNYQDAPVFKAKRAVEQALQKSGLTYTILRPSGFASNLLPAAKRFQQSGVYILIGDPRGRTSIISTDDLAQIAAAAPTTEAARNQIFAVGGPEILERGEVPKIFERIFNREPILINPPLMAIDGIRNVLGFVNPELKASLGTFRTLLANDFYTTPAEVEQVESAFNIKMESLESFVRRYLST